MTFETEVQEQIAEILNAPWDSRDGQVVPSTESVKLKDGAVKMEATFLYADLARSTELQKTYVMEFAAKAMRIYLHGAASIIRHFGGSVRSFDGDRVMGVFAGKAMRNDAVRAAFAIDWMLTQVIAPLVKKRHEDNDTRVWIPSHGIGIDWSEVLVARAGINNRKNETSHNDLIFIGRAPNIAAKLSSLRGTVAAPITITHDVFQFLNDAQKKHLKSETEIWSASKEMPIGPYSLSVHQTSYWRSPNA